MARRGLKEEQLAVSSLTSLSQNHWRLSHGMAFSRVGSSLMSLDCCPTDRLARLGYCARDAWDRDLQAMVLTPQPQSFPKVP